MAAGTRNLVGRQPTCHGDGSTLRGMARRLDPERLYIAQRMALSARLVSGARMSEATAELGVTAWESEARQRHLDARKPERWDPAWDWRF